MSEIKTIEKTMNNLVEDYKSDSITKPEFYTQFNQCLTDYFKETIDQFCDSEQAIEQHYAYAERCGWETTGK